MTSNVRMGLIELSLLKKNSENSLTSVFAKGILVNNYKNVTISNEGAIFYAQF